MGYDGGHEDFGDQYREQPGGGGLVRGGGGAAREAREGAGRGDARGRGKTAPDGIGVASVVPGRNAEVRRLLKKRWPGVPVRWVGPELDLGKGLREACC